MSSFLYISASIQPINIKASLLELDKSTVHNIHMQNLNPATR